MYLQLADNGNTLLSQASRTVNPYIFFPAAISGAEADLYVREDYFDDLSPGDFDQLMTALEPYQSEELSTGLSLFGFGKKARGRRAKRQARKATKKDAKNAIRLARADAIRSGTYESPIQSIGNIVGNIFGQAEQYPADQAPGFEVQAPSQAPRQLPMPKQQAGFGGMMTKKMGPLPVWGWLALVVGGTIALRRMQTTT